MFDSTREYIKNLGFPGEDLWNLPTSKVTFADGANFRIEVPTVNTFEAAASLLKEAEYLGITINVLQKPTVYFGIPALKLRIGSSCVKITVVNY